MKLSDKLAMLHRAAVALEGMGAGAISACAHCESNYLQLGSADWRRVFAGRECNSTRDGFDEHRSIDFMGVQVTCVIRAPRETRRIISDTREYASLVSPGEQDGLQAADAAAFASGPREGVEVTP